MNKYFHILFFHSTTTTSRHYKETCDADGEKLLGAKVEQVGYLFPLLLILYLLLPGGQPQEAAQEDGKPMQPLQDTVSYIQGGPFYWPHQNLAMSKMIHDT